eukprot:m.231108 g.231108  ORF g.231108 m.231108 type:complete len:230 (+) comp40064_c0_seq2:1227-1916(+)
MSLGKFDKALRSSRTGLKISKSILLSGDPGLAKYLFQHALSLLQTGNFRESSDLFKECISLIISSCVFVDEHGITSLLGESLADIHICFERSGKPMEAVFYLEELLTVIRTNYSPDHLFLAEALFVLGVAYLKEGHKTSLVLKMLEESLKIYCRNVSHPEAGVECIQAYAMLLISLHRFKEAAEFLQKVPAIFSLADHHISAIDRCWAIFYLKQDDYPNCADGCIHNFD